MFVPTNRGATAVMERPKQAGGRCVEDSVASHLFTTPCIDK
jgi:hypothetical protein